MVNNTKNTDQQVVRNQKNMPEKIIVYPEEVVEILT